MASGVGLDVPARVKRIVGGELSQTAIGADVVAQASGVVSAGRYHLFRAHVREARSDYPDALVAAIASETHATPVVAGAGDSGAVSAQWTEGGVVHSIEASFHVYEAPGNLAARRNGGYADLDVVYRCGASDAARMTLSEVVAIDPALDASWFPQAMTGALGKPNIVAAEVFVDNDHKLKYQLDVAADAAWERQTGAQLATTMHNTATTYWNDRDWVYFSHPRDGIVRVLLVRPGK